MRRSGSVLVVAAMAAALAGTAPAAGAPVPAIMVIGEAYGGGGNTGAPYRSDFVELFNRGREPADLGGMSIQYASAAGSTWQVVPLAGTVPAGGRWLVQLFTGSSGSPLPAPDQAGTVNMSAIAGKVALVSNTTPLGCATGCATLPQVIDFLGYGSASAFEGSGPAPATSNTTSVARIKAGCVDTDGNSADFAVGPPTPENSASPATLCNTPPIAFDDTTETDEDAIVVIPVLDNDSDPEDDPITVESTSGVSTGATATPAASGTAVEYTPAPDYNGVDSFQYLVADSFGAEAVATVTVTIHPVPDPPVARDDQATTPQYTPVTIDVLANDTDADDQPLRVASVTAPTHGSAAVNGDGMLIYTPDATFKDSDSFSYTVADPDGLTDTATVTVLEEGCGEDGVDALHDTPLDGTASRRIDRDVEPVLGGISPALAEMIHDANCEQVVPAEDAIDEVIE